MIEIQLPNDIESKGWKNTNRFQCEQVFYSPSCGFTGTKYEFSYSIDNSRTNKGMMEWNM